MSYLNAPRLHFAGRFRADVSTVNNFPTHFRNPDDPPDPLWNKNGTGGWSLQACKVTSAVRADGTIARRAADDPVVGAAITQSGKARLVDLDPEQQLVSQIWGMKLGLADAAGAAIFSGAFKVTAFSDIWNPRSQGPGGGDVVMGAFFHSVLAGVVWSGSIASQLLRDLHQASADGLLSIKFNVDGFDEPSKSGRVVGTIGPVQAGEPEHFILGRHCMPVSDSAPIWFFPAVLDSQRGKLVADLGNALPTTASGGPIVPTLQLELGTIAADQSFNSLGPVAIGPTGWYEQTAAVCEFPAGRTLTAAEMTRVQTTPIALRAQTSSGPAIWAQEGSDGFHVRAETFVYRMSANDQARITLRASQFGKPVAGQDVTAVFDSSMLQGGDPNPTVGDPGSALSFPATLTTDAQGIATLTISANAIGKPRDYIDGQVYGIRYRLANADPTTGYQNPFNFISVLLWSNIAQPSAPNWWSDVQPIFKQYANLYAVMKNIVDLGDYDNVVANKDRVRAVFMLPEDDAQYMPVTRDLSPAKRQMILSWLATTGNAGKPNLGVPPPAAVAAVPAMEVADANRLGGKSLALARTGTQDA